MWVSRDFFFWKFFLEISRENTADCCRSDGVSHLTGGKGGKIFLLSWVDQLLLLVLERPDCVEPSGSSGWRGVARAAPACNAPAAHQQATPQFRYVWLVLLAVPRRRGVCRLLLPLLLNSIS